MISIRAQLASHSSSLRVGGGLHSQTTARKINERVELATFLRCAISSE